METHSIVLPGLKRISILVTLCIPLWVADEIHCAPGFISVKASREFSDASAADAIAFACFETSDEAKAFFRREELPFEMSLLRDIGGQKCHLFYKPTIRGFRADPDNKPITELFFDVQSLRFLTKTQRVIGDPLDIVKHSLSEIKRPLEIHVGINILHEEEFYQSAREFHFKNLPHHIVLRNSHTDVDNWPQDYLKSGSIQGEKKILIPHRLYEGKPDFGDLYKPLLDEFREHRYVRSKLSWEGGDLHFVSHPKNAQKTILFYGHSAKTYLDTALSQNEYAYILKLEFGADYLVDLSDLAPHVDYFVSFIPEENIALVSEPMRQNYAIARMAAQRLLEFIGERNPVPVELVNLKNLLSCHDQDCVSLPQLKQQLQEALIEMQLHQEDWISFEDTELQERLNRYMRFKCGEDSGCVGKLYSPPQGQSEILKDDLDLLRDCNDAYLIASTRRSLFKSYVAIIKSQFTETSQPLQKRINEKIQQIKDLGFRVILVPGIGADGTIPWSGISYVNNLLVDNLLFLPKFGLGAVEDEIFDGIQKQLPSQYRVVPVFSQNSIVYNGGIHCRAGIVR